MNVLIIPEDSRKDKYVLLPIVKAMITAAGRQQARVKVCEDPLLGGVEQALSWDRIQEILSMYPMVDLFLLIVDRDQKEGRRDQLDRLEALASGLLQPQKVLLGANAWQEVEVWVLAGHDLPHAWLWRDIRDERDPKEAYYEPLAQMMGVIDEPDEGRDRLAREAAKRYARIRQLCPEVAELEAAILQRVG